MDLLLRHPTAPGDARGALASHCTCIHVHFAKCTCPQRQWLCSWGVGRVSLRLDGGLLLTAPLQHLCWAQQWRRLTPTYGTVSSPPLMGDVRRGLSCITAPSCGPAAGPSASSSTQLRPSSPVAFPSPPAMPPRVDHPLPPHDVASCGSLWACEMSRSCVGEPMVSPSH